MGVCVEHVGLSVRVSIHQIVLEELTQLLVRRALFDGGEPVANVLGEISVLVAAKVPAEIRIEVAGSRALVRVVGIDAVGLIESIKTAFKCRAELQDALDGAQRQALVAESDVDVQARGFL